MTPKRYFFIVLLFLYTPLFIKIKKILSQGLSLCHLAYKLLHISLYSITGQGYKTGFRLQKSTHRITLYLKNCKTFVLYAAV